MDLVNRFPCSDNTSCIDRGNLADYFFKLEQVHSEKIATDVGQLLALARLVTLSSKFGVLTT